MYASVWVDCQVHRWVLAKLIASRVKLDALAGQLGDMGMSLTRLLAVGVLIAYDVSVLTVFRNSGTQPLEL
jgi:hypothetical protein